MRSRADRNRDFEQTKETLFEAGVSVLKAAQAHEEMFHTSLEALTEAIEGQSLLPAGTEGVEAPGEMSPEPIRAKLLVAQQKALKEENVDAYLQIGEKLKLLKELEVIDVELEARKLEAHIRIANARQQLAQFVDSDSSSTSQPWTEETLKAKFKTLKNLYDELGIKARSWKEAAKQANQRTST